MNEDTYKLSEKKKEVIADAYKKYNFPGIKRLFELISNDGYKITKEEIKAFLDEQEPEQILRPVIMPHKKSQGSIVAYYPNERFQIDIFSLFNFVKNWRKSPYKYAFCAIDIFTRKAWAIPMTKKNNVQVIHALKTILAEVNHEPKPKPLRPSKDDKEEETIDEEKDEPEPEDNTTIDGKSIQESIKGKFPKIITADQDSVFMGQDFNDVLDKYQITFDAYIKGDHNALGVIDSFAKRLKLAIAKYIIQTNNKINWDIIMKTVIDNYNQTPNTAIDGIKPNEAHIEKNQSTIYLINLNKPKGKTDDSDLVIGDKVRIALAKTLYTKSSSPQFSNEIYTVILSKGSNIKLNNNKTYKRYSLLKVVHSAKPILVNHFADNQTSQKVQKALKILSQEKTKMDLFAPRKMRSDKRPQRTKR